MDNSLMVALQNQRILQERLDVTANNLANAATTGFKADGLLFEQLIKRPAQSEALPHDVRFVADAGLMRDMSQGPIMRTGSPLDVAIEGDGFFIVQGPNGMAYTRDGSFTISQDGTLVTKDGRPVLSQTGSPVVFDSQGGNPTIDADGSVRVTATGLSGLEERVRAALAALFGEGTPLELEEAPETGEKRVPAEKPAPAPAPAPPPASATSSPKFIPL